MRDETVGRVLVIATLVLGIGLAAAANGWAQQTTPPSSVPANDGPAVKILATIAAAAGSLVHVPFKLGIICPAMALASGGSLAVTGGDRATAEYLLRVGCTGTYVITPGMIRGQEEFEGAGAK